MRPSQTASSPDGKASYAIGEVLTSWDHVIYTTIKSDDPEATGGQQVVLEPDYRAARVPANYGRVLTSPLIELKPLEVHGAPCSFSFVNLSHYEHQDPLIREKFVGSFGLAIILALELSNTPDVGGRLGGPFRHALLAAQKRLDRQTLHLAALMLHDQLTAAAPDSQTQRRLDAALASLWNERDGSRRKQILLGYINSLVGLGELLPSDAEPGLPAYLIQPSSAARTKRLYITYNREWTLRAVLGYAAQVASILHCSSLDWTTVELNGSPKTPSPSDFRDRGLSVLFLPEAEIGIDRDDGPVVKVAELPRLDSERSRELTAVRLFGELGLRFEPRLRSSPSLEPVRDAGPAAAPGDGKPQSAGDATVMIAKDGSSGPTNKVLGDCTVHDASQTQMNKLTPAGGLAPGVVVPVQLPSPDTVPLTVLPNLLTTPALRSTSTTTPRRDLLDGAAHPPLPDPSRTTAAVPFAAGDETGQPGNDRRSWLFPEGLIYHLITILLLLAVLVGLYWIPSQSWLFGATLLPPPDAGTGSPAASPAASPAGSPPAGDVGPARDPWSGGSAPPAYPKVSSAERTETKTKKKSPGSEPAQPAGAGAKAAASPPRPGPAGAAGAAGPAKPTGPAGSPGQTKPAGAGGPAKTAQPAGAPAPKSAGAARPTGPAKPAESVKPKEPIKPAEPTGVPSVTKTPQPAEVSSSTASKPGPAAAEPKKCPGSKGPCLEDHE